MSFAGFFREPIFQAFPIRLVFLPFPMLWKIDDKTHAFLTRSSIPQDGNLMEKRTHFMEKVISQAFHIRLASLSFPMLWETDGETYAFPIC